MTGPIPVDRSAPVPQAGERFLRDFLGRVEIVRPRYGEPEDGRPRLAERRVEATLVLGLRAVHLTTYTDETLKCTVDLPDNGSAPAATPPTLSAIDASSARSYTQSDESLGYRGSFPDPPPPSNAPPSRPTARLSRPAARSPSRRRVSTASGSWSSSVGNVGTGPASLWPRSPPRRTSLRAYLEQLVVSLREAGLVTSTRGAHGGYELARTARDHLDGRGCFAPSKPDRPDDVCQRRPGTRDGLRPQRPLHGQRPVGPRPRRGHGRLDSMTPPISSRPHPRAGQLTPIQPTTPPGSHDHPVTTTSGPTTAAHHPRLRVAPIAAPTTRSSRGST